MVAAVESLIRLVVLLLAGYAAICLILYLIQDHLVFFRQPLQRHTAHSEFDLSGTTSLPRVDVVMVYQDAPGDLIKAAVDAGARGIVIASAGAGATSGTQNAGLSYAAEKGVFIVTSTRTGSGRIAPSRPVAPTAATAPSNTPANPAFEQRRRFTVAAEDHTPLKARILLMLALTRTNDRAEIQRMFSEY